MPFPVDPIYIRAAEEKLGVRFPDAFVASMTALNGGRLQGRSHGWPV